MPIEPSSLAVAAVPTVLNLVGNLFGGDDDDVPMGNYQHVGPTYSRTGLLPRMEQMNEDILFHILNKINEFESRFTSPDQMNARDRAHLKELEDQLKFHQYVQDPERARHDFFLTEQDYRNARAQYEREVGPLIRQRDEQAQKLEFVRQDKLRRLNQFKHLMEIAPLTLSNEQKNTQATLASMLDSWLSDDTGEPLTLNEFINKKGINVNNIDLEKQLDERNYTLSPNHNYYSGHVGNARQYPAAAQHNIRTQIPNFEKKLKTPSSDFYPETSKRLNELNKEIERRSQPYIPIVQQYETWRDKLPIIQQVHQAKRLEAEKRQLEERSAQDPIEQHFDQYEIPHNLRADIQKAMDLRRDLVNLQLEVHKAESKDKIYLDRIKRLETEYKENPTPQNLGALEKVKELREREHAVETQLNEQLTNFKKTHFPFINQVFENLPPKLNRDTFTTFEQEYANKVDRSESVLSPAERQKLAQVREKVRQVRKDPIINAVLEKLPPPEVFKEKIEDLQRKYETVAPISERQKEAGETFERLQAEVPRMYQDLETDIDRLMNREFLNEQQLNTLDRLARDIANRDNRPMLGELQKMAQGDFDRLKYTIPGIFRKAGASNTAARVAAENAMRSGLQSRASSALTRFEHEEEKDKTDQQLKIEQLKGNLRGLTSDRLHRLYGDRRGVRDQYFNTMDKVARERFGIGEKEQQNRQAENLYRMGVHNTRQQLPVNTALAAQEAFNKAAQHATQTTETLGGPAPVTASAPSQFGGVGTGTALGNMGAQMLTHVPGLFGGSAPAITGGGGGGGFARGGRAYPSLESLKEQYEPDPYQNEYLQAIRELQNTKQQRIPQWLDENASFYSKLAARDPSKQNPWEVMEEAKKDSKNRYEQYGMIDREIAKDSAKMYETLNDSKRKTMEFLERYTHNKAATEEAAVGHDITDRHYRASEKIQRENNALMNDFRRQQFESLDAKRQADIERDQAKLKLKEDENEIKRIKEQNVLNKRTRGDDAFSLQILNRHNTVPRGIEMYSKGLDIASKLNSGGFGSIVADKPIAQSLAGVGRQADIEIFDKLHTAYTNAMAQKTGGKNAGIGTLKFEERGTPSSKLTPEANMYIIRGDLTELYMQKKLDDAISKIASSKRESPIKVAMELTPEWNDYGKDVYSNIQDSNMSAEEIENYINDVFSDFTRMAEQRAGNNIPDDISFEAEENPYEAELRRRRQMKGS